MTGKELNEKIAALCEVGTAAYEAFGGKAIAYIGWFWRDVDFGADSCALGVVPPSARCVNCSRTDYPAQVGFMPDNKWGYDTITVEGEPWRQIKAALEKAAHNPTRDNLKAVDDMIQALYEGEGVRE